MSRLTPRILLSLSILISIIVCFIGVKSALDGDPTSWAVVAATLAVITSVIASLNSQRVVELEEDRLLPHVEPSFDLKSRYGLVLFRVQNLGASSAYKIKLLWDKPLVNRKGKVIKFGKIDSDFDVPVLLPGVRGNGVRGNGVKS